MAVPTGKETDLEIPKCNVISLFVDDYKASSEALSQIEDSHLSKEQRDQFRQLIREYADVFAEDENALGRTDEIQHEIKLTNETPVKQAHYRVAHNKKKFLDEEVQRMLKQGIVVESDSSWASPVVLIRKPNGKWRFCVDFRLLNAQTSKDAFPLPIIDDLLDAMNGAKYYSSLDLQAGFWQIGMDPVINRRLPFALQMAFSNSP